MLAQRIPVRTGSHRGQVCGQEGTDGVGAGPGASRNCCARRSSQARGVQPAGSARLTQRDRGQRGCLGSEDGE